MYINNTRRISIDSLEPISHNITGLSIKGETTNLHFKRKSGIRLSQQKGAIIKPRIVPISIKLSEMVHRWH